MWGNRPQVHFSDTALAEKKASRQERLTAREKATKHLDKLQLGRLWHREPMAGNKVVSRGRFTRSLKRGGRWVLAGVCQM